ncbi:hypothetical protein [Listeria booriae]|uniref:hypothetical protein n=1 Tax=Listeria booriae TaxID=1552123 RepID=UPI00162438F6|nr:hypothetical protein [Listeria booriae]MBC1983039.1 hypothetical protein [Listeria booriae]
MAKTNEQLQAQVRDFFFMKGTMTTKDDFEESTLDHIKTVMFKTVMEATDFLVETYGEEALFDRSLTESRHFVFDNGDIWKNRADPHCRFFVTRDFWYVIEYDAVYAEKNPTLFIACEDDVERKEQRNTNDEKTEDELLRELLTPDEFEALRLFREGKSEEELSMKFNKKLENEILDDLEARRMRARFKGIKDDKDVAQIETELRFFKCGLKGEVPTEWVARYGESE